MHSAAYAVSRFDYQALLNQELERALEFANSLSPGEDAEILLSRNIQTRDYWRIIQVLKQRGFLCRPNIIRHDNGYLQAIRNQDGMFSLQITNRIRPIPPELTASARMAEHMMWNKINLDQRWSPPRKRRKTRGKRVDRYYVGGLWGDRYWQYWEAP